MKKKLLVGLTILALLFTVACGGDRAKEKEGESAEITGEEADTEISSLPSHDKYVAEVDGRGIEKEEFEKNVLFRRYSYMMNYGEEIFEGEGAKTLEDNIRNSVQEELARELVYVILAEKEGFKMDMEEAKKIYEEDFLLKNSPETLKYFEDNNLDEAFVLKRIAIDQMVGGFIEKIQDEYLASDGFKEKKDVLELVRASHIIVETQEEAEEIKALLDEESSRFEMLAVERSKDGSAENEGDLGYFEYGDMVEEFSKAAFDMEVGEISDVVTSQFGYHLIKLNDKGSLLEIMDRGIEHPSLDKKILDLSYNVIGEKLMALYEEQVEKTPIDYYKIEI